MGLCGGSTTTEKSTREALSAQGQEYQLIWATMMANQMDSLGYDINFEEKTSYRDQGKANGIIAAQKNVKQQIADLDTQIATLRSSSRDTGMAGTLEKRRQTLENQLNRLNADLAGMEQETYIDFTLGKKEDARVKYLIDQYGEGSPQVEQMREKIAEEAFTQASQEAEIYNRFLDLGKKYVNGDLSYTPEQAQQAEQYIAPIKDVMTKTFDQMSARYKDDYFAMKEEMNTISQAIDKTGLDVMSALKAAQVRMEDSGDYLVDVLNKATSSREEQAKFEFGLYSKQAEQQAAQQAALLGLPPGSMSEKLQADKLKTDALTKIQLQLGAEARDRELGIRAEQEAGKRSIDMAGINLEQFLGQERLDLAKAKTSLFGDYLGKEQNLLAAKSQAFVDLEAQKQNMLFDVAYGGIPGRLQAGASASSYTRGRTGEGINLEQGVLNPFTQQLGVQQQFQLTDATKVTKTESSPGFFDVLGGIAGTAGTVAGLGGFGSSAQMAFGSRPAAPRAGGYGGYYGGLFG